MANIFTGGNSCEEQDYLTELETLGIDPVIAWATLPRDSRPAVEGWWEEDEDEDHPLVGGWVSMEAAQKEADKFGFQVVSLEGGRLTLAIAAIPNSDRYAPQVSNLLAVWSE